MKKLFYTFLILTFSQCNVAFSQQPTLQQRVQLQFVPNGTAGSNTRLLTLNSPNGNAAPPSEIKELSLTSLLSSNAGNSLVAGTDGLLYSSSADTTTVTDSSTIDLTLTGQDITASILGADTATAGQLPTSNGAGGIVWSEPNIATSGVIIGNGSSGNAVRLNDGIASGETLIWDGLQWVISAPMSSSNIYTADGVLTNNRTLNGNSFDLQFSNLGQFAADMQSLVFNAQSGGMVFSSAGNAQWTAAGNNIVQSDAVLTLQGDTELRLVTPNVIAASATTGQVATLTNSATGTIEFTTPSGATLVQTSINAADDEVTVAIPSGKTADDLVSLHIKEIAATTEEIGVTSWRDDGAGNIVVKLLGSPTNSGEFQLQTRW